MSPSENHSYLLEKEGNKVLQANLSGSETEKFDEEDVLLEPRVRERECPIAHEKTLTFAK